MVVSIQITSNYTNYAMVNSPRSRKTRQTTSPYEDKFPRGLFPANGGHLLATEAGQALGVLWQRNRREGKVQLGSSYGFEGDLMEIW